MSLPTEVTKAWVIWFAIREQLLERARLRFPTPAAIYVGPREASLLALLNTADPVDHPETVGKPPATIYGIPVRVVEHLDGWLITDDPDAELRS